MKPSHELILIVDYGSQHTRLINRAIVTLGICFVCFVYQTPSGYCDEIPTAPPMKTVQFRIVDHSSISDGSEVIIEQVVAAEEYRTRVDMTILSGSAQMLPMPPKQTSIIIYNPTKHAGVKYVINPDDKTVEERVFSGDEPIRKVVSSIDGFRGALYPNDPNNLGRIERTEDQEIDDTAATVYQLTINNRPSLKWWMTQRPNGIWIPLQSSLRVSSPNESERWSTMRIFDIRLDEPLSENLFVVPDGYKRVKS